MTPAEASSVDAGCRDALRPALLSQGAVAYLCKLLTERELRTVLAAASLELTFDAAAGTKWREAYVGTLMAVNSKGEGMSDGGPTVYVVDDDISVRESLEAMFADFGFRPEVFESAEQFLGHPRRQSPSCLILDVSLPDLNGLELQQRLGRERAALPIIFITGHGDIPTTVRAMKAGAIEFLTKPFSTQALLAAVDSAVQRSRALLAEQRELMALRGRHQTLSEREREVMSLVVRGRLNKQVGAELGISEITVKAHRGKVMRKMQAKSLPELVTMASRLVQPPTEEQ